MDIKKIEPKISKLVILEYNSIFAPNLEVTVPNSEDFDRTKEHYSNLYYGASLSAYVNLMNEKGFYFLGVNRLRNNAFFINNDFPKKEFFNKLQDISFIECTNSNFNESRNINGDLNFLSKNKKINEIKNCQIINLKNKENKLIKLKDLI